jgi:hypothetical protein
MNLIWRTIVDKAVGSIAFSWQENYPKKGAYDLRDRQPAPGSWVEQGQLQSSMSVIVVKPYF